MILLPFPNRHRHSHPHAYPHALPHSVLPQAVIDRLKQHVFGFDTFWVTSVDNYGHDGVVFKGNVRGRDPAVSYAKMKERLQVCISVG